MTSPAQRLFEQIISANKEIQTNDLIERLSKTDPKPTANELWHFCTRLSDPASKSSPISFWDQLQASNERWRNRGRVWFQGGYADEFQRLPRIVVDFAVDYLRPKGPKKILNPWTDNPVGISFLFNTLPTLNEALCITKKGETVWRVGLFHKMASKILGWQKKGEWKIAEKRDDPDEPNAEPDPIYSLAHWWLDTPPDLRDEKWDFDVIISFPPLAGAVYGSELLASSGQWNLSEGGVGFYVVPAYFFAEIKLGKVFEDLESEFGLAIEAVLALPPEHRGELYKTDLSLVIVRKGKQGKIFVGELQADPERRNQLLKNLDEMSESKDFSLGMLVEKEDFRSYKALKEKREYEVLLSRQGLPEVNLATLIREVVTANRKGGEAFDQKANTIYLPTIGSSDVVTSIETFVLKPQNYLQVVLDPDVVSAEYLSRFFNSELGYLARKCLFSGITIPRITASALKKGVLLPLPSLSVQGRVIEADTSLRNLSTDIENLGKQLWTRPSQIEKVKKAITLVNREETVDEWIKTLPFPLASILWNYHASAHDPKEQFELMLKFFEGVAEFQATILISAAKRDAELWADVRTYLAKERAAFEKSTFGTWTSLVGHIGKGFRELWNESNKQEGDEKGGRERCFHAFATNSPEIIETMISKPLLAVLGKANQFRNDYGGHYGVLGSVTAANLLVQLRSYLSEVRSSFGQAWDNYQLLLPTDRSEWTGQFHEVLIYLLQGPNTPFLKEKRSLREPLKRNTLYLLDKEKDQAIELLPLLKISNAPKEVTNACYFYNRRQSDGVRFVSYHFEKEADITISPEETERLFGELFGGMEQE